MPDGEITLEPCKRSSGTARAFFTTQDEALNHTKDHSEYREDIVVFCTRCGYYHCSHPTWLESRPWEIIASDVRNN